MPGKACDKYSGKEKQDCLNYKGRFAKKKKKLLAKRGREQETSLEQIMPSKEVCAKKFKAGTKAFRDCVNYKLRGDKDYGDDYKRAQRMRRHEGLKPKKKKPKFRGGKAGQSY